MTTFIVLERAIKPDQLVILLIILEYAQHDKYDNCQQHNISYVMMYEYLHNKTENNLRLNRYNWKTD